jgi:hypothetical protein
LHCPQFKFNMAGIAPERGSVGDWYVCFAALSSNDTDIASWSARTLRGLFLDDNDNNHQNFEVLCNSERCDEKVDEGSKEPIALARRSVRAALVAISVTSAGLVLI